MDSHYLFKCSTIKSKSGYARINTEIDLFVRNQIMAPKKQFKTIDEYIATFPKNIQRFWKRCGKQSRMLRLKLKR